MIKIKRGYLFKRSSSHTLVSGLLFSVQNKYHIQILVILSYFQCLCHACNSGQFDSQNTEAKTVKIRNKELISGKKIECYHLNSGATYLLKWETSNSAILNAILWPTIVFIGGFISLFFSCLALQREKQTRKGSQKKLSSISIEY